MYGVVGAGERKGTASRSPRWSRSRRAREGAVEPHHHRPLHPAAGNFRPPRQAGGGAGGEIQLTDAMIGLAQNAAVLRREIRGPQLRLRLQDRLPRANIAYALARDDIGPAMRAINLSAR